MINGKDELSKLVIKLLNDNLSHREISEITDVSINNIKRLSRFNKLKGIVSANCSSKYVNLIEKLGTKSIVLLKSFRVAKSAGIKELLDSISNETERSELILLNEALLSKAEDINASIDKVKKKLRYLDAEIESTKSELAILKRRTNKYLKKKEQALKLIEKQSPKIKKCLLEHIGFCGDQLAVYRRLNHQEDPYLFKSLEADEYVSRYPVMYIKDLKLFIKDIEKMYDRKISPYRAKFFYYRVESITSDDTLFESKIERCLEYIKNLKPKKRDLKKEIRKLDNRYSSLPGLSTYVEKIIGKRNMDKKAKENFRRAAINTVYKDLKKKDYVICVYNYSSYTLIYAYNKDHQTIAYYIALTDEIDLEVLNKSLYGVIKRNVVVNYKNFKREEVIPEECGIVYIFDGIDQVREPIYQPVSLDSINNRIYKISYELSKRLIYGQ